MQGKTVVITGATSGIGEVAANELARQGARIVLIARDRARGEQTLQRLEEIAPGRNHLAHYANLSRLAEMKRVSEAIAGTPSSAVARRRQNSGMEAIIGASRRDRKSVV